MDCLDELTRIRRAHDLLLDQFRASEINGISFELVEKLQTMNSKVVSHFSTLQYDIDSFVCDIEEVLSFILHKCPTLSQRGIVLTHLIKKILYPNQTMTNASKKDVLNELLRPVDDKEIDKDGDTPLSMIAALKPGSQYTALSRMSTFFDIELWSHVYLKHSKHPASGSMDSNKVVVHQSHHLFENLFRQGYHNGVDSMKGVSKWTGDSSILPRKMDSLGKRKASQVDYDFVRYHDNIGINKSIPDNPKLRWIPAEDQAITRSNENSFDGNKASDSQEDDTKYYQEYREEEEDYANRAIRDRIVQVPASKKVQDNRKNYADYDDSEVNNNTVAEAVFTDISDKGKASTSTGKRNKRRKGPTLSSSSYSFDAGDADEEGVQNESNYNEMPLDEEDTISFTAKINVNGKSIVLGSFPAWELAAEAHDIAMMRYHGPENCSVSDLNFSLFRYMNYKVSVFTTYDKIIKTKMKGVDWTGLQKCDVQNILKKNPKKLALWRAKKAISFDDGNVKGVVQKGDKSRQKKKKRNFSVTGTLDEYEPTYKKSTRKSNISEEELTQKAKGKGKGKGGRGRGKKEDFTLTSSADDKGGLSVNSFLMALEEDRLFTLQKTNEKNIEGKKKNENAMLVLESEEQNPFVKQNYVNNKNSFNDDRDNSPYSIGSGDALINANVFDDGESSNLSTIRRFGSFGRTFSTGSGLRTNFFDDDDDLSDDGEPKHIQIPLVELVSYDLLGFLPDIAKPSGRAPHSHRNDIQRTPIPYVDFTECAQFYECTFIPPLIARILAIEINDIGGNFTQRKLADKPLASNDVHWESYCGKLLTDRNRSASLQRLRNPQHVVKQIREKEEKEKMKMKEGMQSNEHLQMTQSEQGTTGTRVKLILIPLWTQCLRPGSKYHLALTNLRSTMTATLKKLEARNFTSPDYIGVRQLSVEYKLYVFDLPENELDPSLDKSKTNLISSGVFASALEAAIHREQILRINNSARLDGDCKANFNTHEWQTLVNIGRQINTFLNIYTKEE